MHSEDETGELDLPYSLGHYTLTGILGRGGMGVVYAAHDARLDRPVAVKMISGISDVLAIKRFWREARAAAAVSHPHVCQVFDVEEAREGLYLAMELLVGETLEQRLARGPLPTREAVKIAVELLGALQVLHDKGFVHRDIKPSNIFLTAHGAKLLDFGLSRPGLTGSPEGDASLSGAETKSGTIVGTPRYMSPEQIHGETLDGRSDLYALGAVLFEMLTGRPPFVGGSFFDLLSAVLKENPPALQGPPDVVAIDRVIRRALAKVPLQRHPSATAMSEELSRISVSDNSESAIPVRALVRLIVLPFRLAPADPEISFLSFSLAEAVASNLALLGDVVVRSTAIGARFAADDLDVRELAVVADVDLVLFGTLRRSGDRVRASLQLVDAHSGTVLGGNNVEATVSDVFALEDSLVSAATRLLEPQRVPSAGHTAPRDVPASPLAFESFLRAMELARSLDGLAEARVHYQSAVDEDPQFAPSWAGLGRCLRVAAKYEGEPGAVEKAERAFKRALSLNPRLSLAHHYLTHLESENGQADAAISRLLEQARQSRNDAQLFAGLVHACRYAGLLAESRAAHQEAKRLDPTIRTSLEYTLLLMGDYENIDAMMETAHPTGDPLVYAFSLLIRNRREEGLALVKRLETAHFPRIYSDSIRIVREMLLGGSSTTLDQITGTASGYNDPDAHFFYGITLAFLGQSERALDLIARAVNAGFAPVESLQGHEHLARVRALPGFTPVLERARRDQLAARAVFDRAGGRELLGVVHRGVS